MIIIDEHADSKLIKALEASRTSTGSPHGFCLHFKLAGRSFGGFTTSVVHNFIGQAALNHIGSASPELYVCEDGDVYILIQALPSKFARLTILEVADRLNIPASDAFASLYELELSANALLLALEQKIQLRQAAVIALQKQHEEDKLRRRRQAILQTDPHHKPQDIKQRRDGRTHPELMMIEDDPFSRRLVENVLKKDYALTSLASADLALAGYAALAPNILFLDINLPDVSGHELLNKLIAMDPDAYIIMLSGNADQANIVSAMKAGAKGFIAKPFNRDKLMQYIERCPTIKAPTNS